MADMEKRDPTGEDAYETQFAVRREHNLPVKFLKLRLLGSFHIEKNEAQIFGADVINNKNLFVIYCSLGWCKAFLQYWKTTVTICWPVKALGPKIRNKAFSFDSKAFCISLVFFLLYFPFYLFRFLLCSLLVGTCAVRFSQGFCFVLFCKIILP